MHLRPTTIFREGWRLITAQAYQLTILEEQSDFLVPLMVWGTFQHAQHWKTILSFAGQLPDCLHKSAHPIRFHWFWVKWSVLGAFASNYNLQRGLRGDHWAIISTDTSSGPSHWRTDRLAAFSSVVCGRFHHAFHPAWGWSKDPTEEMPARMCLVCPRLTTNVDQVDLWRLPTKEGPAISLALSKMHRATEHCSTWTVWSVVWIKQPATPGSHSKLLLTGTVARHPNGILLGHHDLFRLAVGGNTGFRAILQTPLAAKQAICAKADCCTPRTTASQNPPCSTEQAGHVLCDSSKVCGQVGQVARSRRTSPFLRKSTVPGNQELAVLTDISSPKAIICLGIHRRPLGT